mmetsp:Transcript_83698/g.116337  ORF Transcript_83698/g.116337 Transcript_83698/m.116337 type:complete len:236 (-) Transcript_83698:519-1226(-)
MQEASSARDWVLVRARLVLVSVREARGLRSQLQGQTTFLRRLTLVGDRVLEHITAFTIDSDLCALEGALEGVSVQLLQQSSATSKANIVSSNPFFLELLKDLGNGLPVDAVTLDDADVRRQHLVSCRSQRHIFLELLEKNLQDGCARLRWITTVRTHDQTTKFGVSDATLDEILELVTPVVFAGTPDVEGVRDTSHQPFRILFQHVPHGIDLAVHAPGGDRRVLRCWDGKSGGFR